MSVPIVRAANVGDQASAVDTVVLAFAADPVARWCWPDARQYLTSMPSFALAFGGSAFAHNTAHCTDDCAGAALWLPPDVHPDEEALGQIIERTCSPSIRGELAMVMKEMATYHPSELHWYLPLIGVDPAHQGKGYGDALLAYALRQCDSDRTLAYLESTNPRNITLYQRHGFKALGQIQVGSSPPLVPMVRHPR